MLTQGSTEDRCGWNPARIINTADMTHGADGAAAGGPVPQKWQRASQWSRWWAQGPVGGAPTETGHAGRTSRA